MTGQQALEFLKKKYNLNNRKKFLKAFGSKKFCQQWSDLTNEYESEEANSEE